MRAAAFALLVPSLAFAAPPGGAKSRPAAARKAAPPKLAPEANPKLGGGARAFAKSRVRIEAPADRAEVPAGDVAVRFAISAYSLEGGAHAHLIVDNQPALQIDDATNPLVLKNVPPGPHLLRAVLCRPWHEVVKAPHAFSMVRFWSGPRTPGRAGSAAERQAWPDPRAPLLTYVLPLGNPRPDDARFEGAAPAAPAVAVAVATPANNDPNLGGSIADPPAPLPVPAPPPAPPQHAAPPPARRPRPPTLDFYLSHAKLGKRSYKVRVDLDRAELQLVKDWRPQRLPRLRPGRHHIVVDLLDRKALQVPGALNRTDRIFHTP